MKERIVSKANPRVKELVHLGFHPSPFSFLIEGKHMVDMAFERGLLLEVFSLNEVDYPGVKTTLIGEEVLDKIAPSKTPSGIVGIAKAPSKEQVGDALVLDRVQDPGNVGTLLRSALSFGFKNVYFLPGTASPFSSKVLASSQGAIFGLSLHFSLDPMETLDELSTQGYFLLSTALRDAKPISSFHRGEKRLALILGNEGRGIDEKILVRSDERLFIEMEEMESLNVGVAGGIAMYLLRK